MTIKTALITGATSGIGLSSARKFLSNNYFVIAVARNEEKLINLKKEFPAKVEVFSYDLSNKNSRIELFNEIKKTYDSFDVLINSAGILRNGTIETTSLESWNEMIEINPTAIFHLMNLSIPFLEKRKGNIVNISSITGLRSFPNILAYCVSKAGLDQLTRCSALELALKGIRVNAVNPGVVVTNVHRNAGMDEDSYQSFLERSKTTHPLGRIGKPEDIANLIYFLASDEAGWITGNTVSIDGGRNLTCAR